MEMKRIRQILPNTFCTFTVLSARFGVLCRLGVLENLPYDRVVFVSLLESVCTSAFIALREWALPGLEKAGRAIDVVGCCAVILLIGWCAGWMEASVSYFLLILGMVLTVYLLVWLLTWLQSKHDETELNRLLAQSGGRTGSADK